MKYSDIKQVKSFCEGLHSQPCYREVVENISQGVGDFEVNDVRFIKDSVILSIMAEELTSDLYILGCFNAWFISEETGWPMELIEAMQKGEAYEELGELIASSVDMKIFAESYAIEDGYGHHFNHWDGNEEELFFGDSFYHVFDQH